MNRPSAWGAFQWQAGNQPSEQGYRCRRFRFQLPSSRSRPCGPERPILLAVESATRRKGRDSG